MFGEARIERPRNNNVGAHGKPMNAGDEGRCTFTQVMRLYKQGNETAEGASNRCLHLYLWLNNISYSEYLGIKPPDGQRRSRKILAGSGNRRLTKEQSGGGSNEESESNEKLKDKLMNFLHLLGSKLESRSLGEQTKELVEWSASRPHRIATEFEGLPGLRCNPCSQRPFDFFKLIVKDKFFELLARETNHQASNMAMSSGELYNHRCKWAELGLAELEVFLGLLYHMGTVRLNRLPEYWSKSRYLSIPIFSQMMSKERFCSVLQALHFAPEKIHHAPEERLYKVRPLIDYFNTTMGELVSPHKELCLDEALTLWRGRVYFRNCSKSRKQVYGIRLHMLTDFDGTVMKLAVQRGGVDREGDAMRKVVRELLSERLDLNHSVFLGEVYTSVSLVQELLARKVYCTGPLRGNRKDVPPDMGNAVLKEGEVVQMFTPTGVCVLRWEDKRPVITVSSEFTGQLVKAVSPRGKLKKVPRAVIEYNKHFSGLERVDLLEEYYPCEHNALRWYKKLAIHVLQVMLLNSYHLFNRYSGATLKLHNFRLNIIESLLSSGSSRTLPQPTAQGRFLGVDYTQVHLPSYVPKDRSGRRRHRQCEQCQRAGIKTDTLTYCVHCPHQPALCLECFRAYHTR